MPSPVGSWLEKTNDEVPDENGQHNRPEQDHRDGLQGGGIIVGELKKAMQDGGEYCAEKEVVSNDGVVF